MGLWEILKGEQPGIINTLLHYENAGQFGEYATKYALTNHNLKGSFSVFTNVYIPYKGQTTEIDVLMIHERGIFVFESKNYSGWIFGNADQQYWTQSLPNGGKNKFYNPMKQNQTHIKALSEYLNLPVLHFTSYIIFSERCTLKSVPKSSDRIIILRRPKMLEYLRRDLSNRKLCYSSEHLEQFAKMIRPQTNWTEEQKQRHVQQIKENLSGNTCPWCHSTLVLRHGKYGSFWGCSACPKCKFTRKQEET